MSNLTPLFRQYVSIIADESTGLQEAQSETKSSLNEIVTRDSFLKECRSLAKFLFELNTVLKSVCEEYMNDFSMTEAEKDNFDAEARLQLQEYVKKLKHLEQYEEGRRKLIDEQIRKISGSLNFFKYNNRNIDKRDFISYQNFNNDFRSGVLRSLNLWLKYVSSEFSNMQQERLASQRKFQQSLSFSQPSQEVDLNNHSEVDLTESISLTVSQSQPVEHIQDEIKQYEETISQLTQEQLQVLETEHEELINQKNEQLKKVGLINKTIMEIVGVQSELAAHLQVQSQNINSMLDNQDIIETNITKGNKELKKAQRAAGKTAKLTTYIAVIIGILILLLDYIS
ncbi:Syntaxin UFE1 [Nakaseomyces glabratus]|uniref:Syntaxin UFE1 n=1 Tax=Candida glabrata TaxID=5478 RepID=A0A0W0CK03_CANGB|nr:t-SNARE coiled-coil homology domain profile [Nakaseomyces glabratus]KAH7584566.1 t-SNARE coiled-coil homology domain profile [Nakaseomyces glabratus]KAI8383655.1 t-SNARE coiled-coil homology domain profile [Nakaseomyces glabratus]KAI8394599.1 t-SNARE coiled-coil homology domain profile [Nakaseomyces glabratus]KTA95688.1 Syntaxin UFE1 [Nakaseomyces glabratus]